MARKPLLNIRLDEDAKARWEAAAEGEGLSLSTFVRRCVEDAMREREAVEMAFPGFDLSRGGLKVTRPAAMPEITAAVAPPRARTKAPPKVTPDQVEAVKPKRARTGLCPHRRKPDEYCSRCDA